jgi:DNA primase
MPLAWSEVTSKLDPRKFTMRTAVARMKRLKADPLRPLLELKPDLFGALERLQQRLG